MKNELSEKHGRRKRGAALMIAVITAVVVMLAATLLITLTQRMIDAHTERMILAQVTLSEASAADGLAQVIQQEGGAGVSRFELAGVETDFSLVETGAAGIRTGFYRLEGAASSLIVPAGETLFTAYKTSSGVAMAFYDHETFTAFSEQIVETSMMPVAGAPADLSNEEGVIAVFEGGGETMVCAVTPDGIMASAVFPSLGVHHDSFLSAHEFPDGTVMVILSGGSSSGLLLDLSCGGITELSSPPGTTPVFMPDGTVMGSIASGPSFSVARVRDLFPGDFNNDGITDMAFATGFSLAVFSGATGELFSARPGGSLSCWGHVQGRNGLAGMWRMPDGSEEWFRLGYDGFTEFTPDMIYRMGWEGRFTGYGNTFTGFIDGTAVVSSGAGYLRELLEGNVIAGDADGHGIDYFLPGEDGVEACFNPLYGDGVRMTYKARNSYLGRDFDGNTHVFELYESPSGRRVFHSLEGTDS